MELYLQVGKVKLHHSRHTGGYFMKTIKCTHVFPFCASPITPNSLYSTHTWTSPYKLGTGEAPTQTIPSLSVILGKLQVTAAYFYSESLLSHLTHCFLLIWGPFLEEKVIFGTRIMSRRYLPEGNTRCYGVLGKWLDTPACFHTEPLVSHITYCFLFI